MRTARTLTFSLALFAVHYAVFGKADGTPDRSAIVFGTVAFVCHSAGRDWPTRGRFLATTPIVFLVVGIYLQVFAGQDGSRTLVWMLLSVPFCLIYWFLLDQLERRER